jgi:hypothetical protein
MCIRALDYCPPVDLTFGDYLRGIITADLDLKGEDQHEFRLAFIAAFRRRGIYPRGIKALSVDGISHPRTPPVGPETQRLLGIIGDFLRNYRQEVQYLTDREKIFDISRKFSGEEDGLHSRIAWKFDDASELQNLTGLAWNDWKQTDVTDSRAAPGVPRFAVQNLRLVSRTSPKGDPINNIVFSVVQRVGVRMRDEAVEQVELDRFRAADPDVMIFRGGCTFVFDLDSVELKYIITKPLLATAAPGDPPKLDEARVRAQHEYQFETGPNSMSDFRKYFDMGFARALTEPFALLHQH